LDRAHRTVPELLKPGLTELELSAALEYRLRVLGHQGLVRVRNRDLEIHYGHVLSGVAGLAPAYVDTPSGGPGFSHAFPQGPSLKQLAPHEPISVDLAACVNGYVVDMTRMYALQGLPEPAWTAWRVVEELYRTFEAEARPGVMPGAIFHRLWDLVKAAGLQDFFMGPGPERVSFLGHGVGLELDEFPLISARFPYPLEAGVVLAFEPKFFLPGIGMLGLEDTGCIGLNGVEWLTRSPREITVL
jgi:Xaa-Pro dipeptidase